MKNQQHNLDFKMKILIEYWVASSENSYD